MEEIKVYLIKRTGRPNYYAKWEDPETGVTKMQSTGCTKLSDAERWAGNHQAQLKEGRYRKTIRMSWEDFRDLYEDEKDWQANETFKAWLATAAVFERTIRPKTLATLDANTFSRFARKYRETGVSEETVHARLCYLRAAMNWAARRKLIHEAPEIEMPKRTGESKGRPITAEEFDRILDQIPKRMDRKQHDVEAWKFYLRGLWWSGLRLDESLKLSWEPDAAFSIDMECKYPMLRIRSGAQKNRKAELLPLAPEFCEMLHSIPQSEREGFVFPLKGCQGRYTVTSIGRWIRRFGKLAGVKVAEKNGKVKFASGHDFRRSFGSRWAKRVMPAVLMRLMRHASLSVTMTYYATHDAESVSEAAFKAWSDGDTLGDTAEKHAEFPVN